jgi:hypothetical protein
MDIGTSNRGESALQIRVILIIETTDDCQGVTMAGITNAKTLITIAIVRTPRILEYTFP